MKRVTDRLRSLITPVVHSRNLADVLWVGSGIAAGGAMGALSSAILARALGVEEFGIFTLVVSIVLMLASLCDLGISGSMVRFGAESLARHDEGRFRLVMGYAARAKLVVTALVLVGAAVLLKPILSMVGGRLDGRIETYFLYSLVTVVLLAFGQFFPPIYQAYRRFRQQSIASVSGSAVRPAILVLLLAAAVPLRVGTALWIEGITALALILAYWVWAPSHSIDVRSRDPSLRSSMLSFNKWLSIYLVINTLGARIDVVMLGGLADARALGLYGAAMKIVSLTLIGSNAYLTVLIPDLASVLDHATLRRKRHNAMVMVGAICAGLGLLALFAPLLVRILYGRSFEEVTPLVRVMMGGTAMLVLCYPVTGTLYVLNKTVVSAVMACVSVTVVAGLCWILIPKMNAMGAAIAYAGGGLASTVVAIGYYMLWGKNLEQAHPWKASPLAHAEGLSQDHRELREE